MNKLIALTGVLTLIVGASPALAANIVVTNDNTATVANEISTRAVTGGNVSNGADGVNSIDGGTVTNADYGNQAGNGGNVVLGGLGGRISTGDASATSNVLNNLNTSRTRIEATPWAVDNITVTYTNSAIPTNSLDTRADTSNNTSNGGIGSNVLQGGSVDKVGSSNTAGNGNNHVEGGSGDVTVTGKATAASTAVNILNRTITRIMK